MDGFMQLVKDMRAAQKEYFAARYRTTYSNPQIQSQICKDLLQKSKALERRVDEEIAAAERQDFANGTDCVRMANGQILRQGNLFEDQ